MISKWRKKPLVIEAVQFDGSASSSLEIELWSGGKCRLTDSDGMVIDTLEGRLYVSDDDWVIRGVQGEYYPCKPEIFQETYEVVE